MKKNTNLAERPQPPPIPSHAKYSALKAKVSFGDESTEVPPVFVDVIQLSTTKSRERGFLFTSEELLSFSNRKNLEKLEALVIERLEGLDSRKHYSDGELYITVYVCRESTEAVRYSVRKNSLNMIKTVFQIMAAQCFLKNLVIAYIDDDFNHPVIWRIG